MTEKHDLILQITDKMIDAEQNANWQLDRLKDDGDDDEILQEFFNNKYYLQFQSFDDLQEIAKLSQDEYNKRVQEVFNRLTE